MPSWLLWAQWGIAALMALALAGEAVRGPGAAPTIAGGTAANRAWRNRTTFTSWWARWQARRSNARGTALHSPEPAQLAIERAEAFLAAALEREAAGWRTEPLSRGCKAIVTLDVIAFLAFHNPLFLGMALGIATPVLLPSDWERRRIGAARPRVLQNLQANRRVLHELGSSPPSDTA